MIVGVSLTYITYFGSPPMSGTVSCRAQVLRLDVKPPLLNREVFVDQTCMILGFRVEKVDPRRPDRSKFVVVVR